MVYLDRASKATQSPAELMSVAPRTNILPRTTGPFGVLSSTTDTVTVDQDGLANTLSIDRVTVDLNPNTTDEQTKGGCSHEQAESAHNNMPYHPDRAQRAVTDNAEESMNAHLECIQGTSTE